MGTAAGAAGAVGSAVGEAAMEGIKGLGGDSMGGRIDTKTAGIRESKAAAIGPARAGADWHVAAVGGRIRRR